MTTDALKAFTITMWVIVLIALGAAFAQIAHAGPTCEPRSAEHAAQHHQTREADSRFHVLHGELPTCGLDGPKRDDSHQDNDSPSLPRRDHEGFHCTWHGCG